MSDRDGRSLDKTKKKETRHLDAVASGCRGGVVLEDSGGALLYIWSPSVSVCGCLAPLPAHSSRNLLLAKQLGLTVNHLWPDRAWGVKQESVGHYRH